MIDIKERQTIAMNYELIEAPRSLVRIFHDQIESAKNQHDLKELSLCNEKDGKTYIPHCNKDNLCSIPVATISEYSSQENKDKFIPKFLMTTTSCNELQLGRLFHLLRVKKEKFDFSRTLDYQLMAIFMRAYNLYAESNGPTNIDFLFCFGSYFVQSEFPEKKFYGYFYKEGKEQKFRSSFSCEPVESNIKKDSKIIIL